VNGVERGGKCGHPLQILLLMAGAGRRFSGAGITIPKPFLEVEGVPMFRHSLLGLQDLPLDPHVSLVAREEHRAWFETPFAAPLSRERIVLLPEVTSGPLESAWLASQALSPGESLGVLDCDLSFRCRRLGSALDHFGDEPAPQALLLSFVSREPRYSFLVPAGRSVIQVAEKKAISGRAIAGCYFFASVALFRSLAEEVLFREGRPQESEPFLSAAISLLLQRGERVEWLPLDHYRSFGTPDELAASLREGPEDSERSTPL